MCGCRTKLFHGYWTGPERNTCEKISFFIKCFRRKQSGDGGLNAKLRRVKSELATIAFCTPPHMLMCVECEICCLQARAETTLLTHISRWMRNACASVFCAHSVCSSIVACAAYVKHLFTVFGYILNGRVIWGETTEEQKHERRRRRRNRRKKCIFETKKCAIDSNWRMETLNKTADICSHREKAKDQYGGSRLKAFCPIIRDYLYSCMVSPNMRAFTIYLSLFDGVFG